MKEISDKNKAKQEEDNKKWKPDGTKHDNGQRYFPDGKKVSGVNLR